MNWQNRISLREDGYVINSAQVLASHILRLVAEGWSEEQLFNAYPGLTKEDIMAAYSLAADIIHAAWKQSEGKNDEMPEVEEEQHLLDVAETE